MTYTWTQNGKTVVSNYPQNEQMPSGTKYKIDVHLTIPLAKVEALGVNLLDDISFDKFGKWLFAQGYHGTISNFNVVASGNYDVIVTFTGSSPIPYLVAFGILGIISIVILYYIDKIILDITKPLSSGGSASVGILVLLLIGLGGIAIAGGLTYEHYKGGKK